jgi:hypothetical protein
MKTDFWLDVFPLWGVFLLTIAAVLVSMGIGVLLGERVRRRPEHETETSIGTIVGATLGLLAFLLAFTFGGATERLQTRKKLLLDEVNAIGTTYLRAELLGEPHPSEIKKLLRDYVDVRVDLAKAEPSRYMAMLSESIARSEGLQDRMWSQVVAMAQAGRDTRIEALFIDSLNHMIDLQTSRATVFEYRLPPVVWQVLYVILMLSMLMVGYQAGLAGKGSWKVGIILALTFATAFYLIADLDSPLKGTFRVRQQPIFELQKKMQANVRQAATDETGKEATGEDGGTE